MKLYDRKNARLGDTAAESVINRSAQEIALESHLQALQDRYRELARTPSAPNEIADGKLQMARTLVNLERGAEAWPLAREALDTFIRLEDFESAADACDVLFQSDQPDSLSALGQGIWLTVTYPMDPELSVELLTHVVDETPDDADGAAVAATTALFLADIRASGTQRENLMFFATQILGTVARRHSNVDGQEALDSWMERLELKEPGKFLVRLRNVVDVLVQDNWWFDREALQARLPVN
ncbi:MAG: hypothetical protein LGR52_11075 [Candidatus Thiosymbion ectosymbiont of Robbea hypermnestra]|nr:hypothetical protein [Candidatus Thiosymbion ectosymbiont of Robbea hypermnestra]